jgi:3-hydroxyacyl-[acyl-carrier-protein] dehydratase
MRFYLVDRVLELDLGKSIKGIKCWTMTDRIFDEHFPGFPVVPGVLLIESCAQLLGVLIEKTFVEEFPEKEKVYVMLSMVHKAKFRDMILPGDKCEILGKLKTLDYNRASGSAEIYLDQELVSEVELSFIIIPQSKIPNLPSMSRRLTDYTDVILRKRNNKKGTV